MQTPEIRKPVLHLVVPVWERASRSSSNCRRESNKAVQGFGMIGGILTFPQGVFIWVRSSPPAGKSPVYQAPQMQRRIPLCFSAYGNGAFAPESWVGSAIQPYQGFAGIRFIRGQIISPFCFLCVPASLREELARGLFERGVRIHGYWRAERISGVESSSFRTSLVVRSTDWRAWSAGRKKFPPRSAIFVRLAEASRWPWLS